jgi:hypothetical protein
MADFVIRRSCTSSILCLVPAPGLLAFARQFLLLVVALALTFVNLIAVIEG